MERFKEIVVFAVFGFLVASVVTILWHIKKAELEPEPPPPTTISFETLLVDADGIAVDARFTIEGEHIATLAAGHRWQIMTPRKVVE